MIGPFDERKPGVFPIPFMRNPDEKRVKKPMALRPRPRRPGRWGRAAEGFGARRADIGQGEVAWVVMADIEGNEFCVLKLLPKEDTE